MIMPIRQKKDMIQLKDMNQNHLLQTMINFISYLINMDRRIRMLKELKNLRGIKWSIHKLYQWVLDINRVNLEKMEFNLFLQKLSYRNF